MCLIIHKPKGASIPLPLLQSAQRYNQDGFGIMALDEGKIIRVTRRIQTDHRELLDVYDEYAEGECVLHLRMKTRGDVSEDNLHPFKITDRLYLAHNGTLDIGQRLPERSDTWHFVHDRLRPLLRPEPELLHSSRFQRLLSLWVGPHNSLVFMDAEKQKTVIINEHFGARLGDLWLSNTRWFDAEQFGLNAAERVPPPMIAREKFIYGLSFYL